MQRIISFWILVCMLLSAAPAVAHHAFATEFDAKKPVTIDITGARSGLILRLHAARSAAP